MDGIKTRKEFEDLLLSLEGSGDDPIFLSVKKFAQGTFQETTDFISKIITSKIIQIYMKSNHFGT